MLLGSLVFWALVVCTLLSEELRFCETKCWGTFSVTNPHKTQRVPLVSHILLLRKSILVFNLWELGEWLLGVTVAGISYCPVTLILHLPRIFIHWCGHWLSCLKLVLVLLCCVVEIQQPNSSELAAGYRTGIVLQNKRNTLWGGKKSLLWVVTVRSIIMFNYTVISFPIAVDTWRAT